jgi:hypothetical protein
MVKFRMEVSMTKAKNLGRVCGLLLLGGMGVAAFAPPAHAYWRGNVWIGVPGPVYAPPPAYYAPPAYVAPPAYAYAPPPYGRVWVPRHWNGWRWVPGHWA